MKHLLTFLAGIVFVSLISAGTATVMTVKLQQPKSVVIDIVATEDVVSYIRRYVKQGYVVKTCSASSSDNRSQLVILEKY